MLIKKMNLNDLTPADYNPRLELKPGMDEYKKLKNSILEFGFIDPPIFNEKTGHLIGGHQRVSVAKDLGLYEEIEVSVVNLSIDKEKALNLALNKISGIWDEEKLAMLLKELDEDNLNLSGFDNDEVQCIIDQYEMDIDVDTEATDDNFEIEIPETPKAKLGDIYQLGNHRLMCGDSTDSNQVEKLMNKEKADMLITDPPYNVNYTGKTKDELVIQNDNKTSNDFYEFLKSAFNAATNNLVTGASFYVWYASAEVVNFVNALTDTSYLVKQELVWRKNVFVLGRQDYHWQHEPCLYGWKADGSHNWYSDRKQTTVLDYDKPLANREHPTMKPVPLFDYQIKNSSKKGDKILDLFGGSGTTMVACEQNGREAYLMELDPRFVDVIINRWENLTGEKAIKVN